MRAEIRRLQRRLGVTSLYVTHDQVEAMTLGDRLLVLHQGRPAQLATPMEVFARPADTYVAGFIGAPTMNFLPADLARGGTAAQLDAGPLLPFADGRRPGADGDASPSASGRSTWTCRRRAGPGDRPDRAARLGDPGARPPGRRRGAVARRSSWSATAPAGERLTVAPQLEHLHVFDRASGRRIDPIGEETAAPPACRCGHG